MKSVLALIFVVVGSQLTLGQGTFQNLDFESARVVFTSTNFDESKNIATTNALPGWSVFLGTNQLFEIPYNASGASYHPISLYGTNAAVLAGYFDVGMGSPAAISQTGLIPNGSETLLFDAYSSLFLVSLGGQTLSYAAISNALNSYGNSYTIYGADISAFAGQTETLTFSGYGIVDNIQFSPEAVPEPSAISFFCLGSGVLLYLRHRRRVL